MVNTKTRSQKIVLGRVDGYVFIIRNGRFKSYKGTLICYADDTAIFQYSAAGKERKLTCSPNEGIFFNNNLWLKTKDADRAANIFIQYNEDLIETHEERIRYYREQISIVKSTRKDWSYF